MTLTILTFLAVFLLVSSVGVLLFYREAMLKRLEMVVSPRDPSSSLLRRFGTVPSTASIGAMLEPLERVLPRTTEETSVVQQRLIRAGYRKDVHLRVFYGAKVAVPLVLCAVATVTGVYEWGPFFIYSVAAGVGFLVPDFWLGHLIRKRQLDIRLGLPEILDLLVICIEAGLSLDQAVLRTADESRDSQPALSDEFMLVNLEQRAGRARADAWKHLADRTDVSSVRSLVALIVQVDQFGTSVAKALRVHADTLRMQRRQQAEEQAAKTAVKLVFPLVLFVFPSIFLVVLGPALIIMFEAFDKYLLS